MRNFFTVTDFSLNVVVVIEEVLDDKKAFVQVHILIGELSFFVDDGVCHE